jgi:hypothetical protein
MQNITIPLKTIFAMKLVFLILLPSLVFAGMQETEEDLAAQAKSKLEAEQADARWKARGEAAISDMIKALCSENFYLHDMAESRLVSIGVPVIRTLFNKSFRRAADTVSDCYGFGAESPLRQVLADIYCNSARFQNYGAEWDTAMALLRGKFIEEPEEALGVIFEVAETGPHLGCGCTHSEALLNKCLPMISTILRGSGKPKGKNNLDNRYWALKTVAAIGPQAAPLVKDILPLLRSGDLDCNAAEALEKIGPAASAAVNELRAAMLRDTSAGNVICFVKALGAMGPKARKALPEVKRLTERMVDESCYRDNQRQIEIAVEALCRLASIHQNFGARFFSLLAGTSDEAVVMLLCKELRMAHGCKRMPVSSICLSLSWLGKPATAAFDELMAFVRDRNENAATRAAAATVIYGFGNSMNLSPSDRKLIMEALPQPVPQVPIPIEMVRDSSTVPSR